ncbi:MAG TPA: cell division protein FtsK, partial [Streptosporangiaceae bacterium]
MSAPWDVPDPDPGDEAASELEGQVVPFPRPAGPPAPAPRKAAAGQRGELRRIVPEHLSSVAGICKAARWRWRRARHISLYHLVRVPKRLPLALVWAAVGLVRVDVAFAAWAFVTEQAYLRGQTIEAGDIRTYLQVHKEGKQTRLFRVPVLIVVHVAVIAAAVVVTVRFPLAWLVIGPLVVPFLAAAGRPDDRPIVDSAVVPTSFEPLTEASLIRALGGLGIGELNRGLREDPEHAVVPIAPITRDGAGWLALYELPHGVTAGEVSERRERLASGLRRPLGCVWPETMHKRHPGALNLYVADEDMTEADRVAWPLAKRGTANVFKPVVFATDPRGRQVAITLMFASGIIGSVPRMGKTFLLRLLLLICALDVRVEIHAYDLKGTGDLAPLRPVAHRYRAGDEPEDMDYLMADLRELRTEMRRRAKVIRDLAEADDPRCPEAKVTPELVADKRLGLHPIAFDIDECQVLFEHPVYGGEAELICTDLTKRGPALAILLWLATQRPDAKSIPTGISANAVLRCCLKVMGQTENDMVLSTSAYKNGIRATMFSFDDKGVAYFAGEGTAPRIIRMQGFDLPASKQIAARARVLREHAGRITGYALGEDLQSNDTRRIADDVLTVFGDARNLWSETIADRLRSSMPEVYADITPDAVASQLRGVGVEVKKVRETGRPATEGSRYGCARAALEAV